VALAEGALVLVSASMVRASLQSVCAAAFLLCHISASPMDHVADIQCKSLDKCGRIMDQNSWDKCCAWHKCKACTAYAFSGFVDEHVYRISCSIPLEVCLQEAFVDSDVFLAENSVASTNAPSLPATTTEANEDSTADGTHRSQVLLAVSLAALTAVA